MALTLLDRYQGAIVGLAVGDALGTTLEFLEPGTFEPLRDMAGGGPFHLQPGEWTDDTSMALCLAESLLERGGFDAVDQMQRYIRWWRTGHLSSHGQCFDIGRTVRIALERFELTGVAYAGSTDPGRAGNGSLMRLAPVPLFFAQHAAEAIARSAESSLTTHGAPEAIDACRLLAALIVGALQGRPKEELLSDSFFESFVQSARPLSPRIAALASGSFHRKAPPAIRGSGYVVESLEAALWAFASTASFHDGALTAVNLGDDADTTGAVFGQVAGAYYGADDIPSEWRRMLACRDTIEDFAVRLFDRATAPRGRRKHVLDLISGGRLDDLNDLLAPTGALVRTTGPIRPLGYREPAECTLREFVGLCRLDQDWGPSAGWPTMTGAEGPTWSLLARIDIDRRPGLLLVDAKARQADLNGSAEAAIAAAYRVAASGVDAVLLWLGFTGDAFFADYFPEHEAFAAAARPYLAEVVPLDIIGKRMPHTSGGSLSIVIGSLTVSERSGQLRNR